MRRGSIFNLLIIIFLIILSIAFGMYTVSVSASSADDSLIANSTNRTPLKDVAAFNPNCVTDQLRWIDSTSATGEAIRPFYDATGIQPYAYFKSYDATLDSDSQKERWAKEYYSSNIKTENGFLFVYFAEKNQDTDVGYMCYVNGQKADSVMDEEAVNIFWQYIDRYWYTDMSTDDVITKTFNNTAKSVMQTSFNLFGAVSTVLIIAVLLLICVFVIRIINLNRETKRRQEARARARRYSRRHRRGQQSNSGFMSFDDTDYSKK